MSFKSNSDDYDATQAMIDMIDINTNHLNGLRTECALSELLTQVEIRSFENKLIRLFGKQSVERQIALLNKNFNVPSPQLRKWLYIVGLSESTIESIIRKIGDDFDLLLSLSANGLGDLMNEASSDERRRLLSAMSNLRLFIEKQLVNDTSVNDLDLHWDSWDQSGFDNQNNNNTDDGSLNYLANDNSSECRSSYPPSPLDESKKLIINSQEQLDIETTNSVTSKSSSKEFKSSPSTPPFLRNNQINHLNNNKLPVTPPSNRKYKTTHIGDNNYNPSMPKSKSHDEHLTNKIDKSSEQFDMNYRRRLESEPCTETKLHNSFSNSRSPPIASPDNFNTSDSCFEEQPSPLASSYSNVNAPRSPRTQGMMHAIHHRFQNRLRPKTVTCNFCGKQMMFGFKCRECKYRCHRECAPKVPPSCGLPPGLFTIFKETLNSRRSPVSSSSTSTAINQQPQTPQCTKIKKSKFKSNIKKSSPDSSSNASSRNSSVPSSPVQPNVNNNTISSGLAKAFTFNNIEEHTSISSMKKRSNPTVESLAEINEQQQSIVSSPIANNNTLDSLDSATNRSLATRLNSQDSQASGEYEQSGDRQWPRQNSLTMREWDIPFDEVKNKEQIGVGRFGTVFKGNWHGSVAIKMFNMANGLDDTNAIEAFRSEVAVFRKTRHENLVLFMGACMKPPHLAIVTSYCKGYPLYTHLHERKEKFNLNRIINISRQVSQGMGYLHARGIVHKDLRSKNIFYDNSNSKVVISDFGFFSLTKHCFSNNERKGQLKIPKGWLCYLAPELMRALKPGCEPDEQDDLPFSFSTDVFSFGTIWHELIFGFLPFEGHPAELVIWQVGKGIKQSLINLQASKEIKDVLMTCWAFKPNDRPTFTQLSEILNNLPKKRLQRSPSHPIQLMSSKHHLF